VGGRIRPITALFLNRPSRHRRLGCEMLAIAWFTALREEMEKAGGGGLYALYCILFWCPGACSDGMGSCERQMGHRARSEDRVNLRAVFACRRGYIIPLCFLL
jgi:hypothetical protein